MSSPAGSDPQAGSPNRGGGRDFASSAWTEPLDRIDDGVVALDADGRIRAANAAAVALMGGAEADLIGQPAWTGFSPEFAPRLRRAWERSGRDGRAVTLTAQQLPGERWCEFRFYPSPEGSTLCLRDVTVRRQSEAIRDCRSAALHDIARGVPLALTMEALLVRIETAVPEMLCSVLVLADDRRTLRHLAAPRLPDAFVRAIDGLVIGPNVGSCGSAAYRGEAVVATSIATDPRWEPAWALAAEHALAACWSTPIFGAGKQVLGTFAIYYRHPGQPPDDHRRWIELVTDLAAVAIQRASADERLQRCEHRYRRLVDSDVVGVVVARPDGDIFEANAYFLNLIGRTEDEVRRGQLNWTRLTPPGWETVDREATTEFRSHGATKPFEKEYLHKDGRRVPVRVTAIRVDERTDDGLCLIEDLTEQKRREAALEEREEQLRLYAEHSPAAIAMLDRELRYIVVSREWMRLYELGDAPIIGRSHYELFPRLPAHLKEGHQRCLQGAVERCDEEKLSTPDGRTRWVQWEIRPWRRGDGEIGGIILFTLDLTARKRAEEERLASESRFRALVDASAQIVWTTDADGMVVEDSPSWRAYTGQTLPACTGLGWLDSVHPDDRERVRKSWRKIVVQQSALATEYRLRHISGEWRWNAIRAVPIVGAQGVVTSWLGMNSDISERKRAEADLHATEERLAAAFRSGLVALMVSRVEDGRIVEVNDAACALTGYTRDEILGRTSAELGLLTAADRERYWTELGTLGAVRDREVNIRTKEGQERAVLASAGFASLQGDRHIIASLVDITDRRRAEEKLATQTEWNRLLQQNMVDGYILADLEGRILESNESYRRLVGYTAEELRAMNIRDLERALHPEEVTARIASFVATRQAQFETVHRAKDGREVALQVSLTLVGEPPDAKVAAFVRDITDRRRAEVELRASHEQMRTLAAKMQTVREEESTAIAREIHDVLAQELTRLKIDLLWLGGKLGAPVDESGRRALAARVQDATAQADHAIGAVQRIATELRPVILDSLGLYAAIEWQVDEFARRTGLVCHVQVPDEATATPPARDQATAIFRILQESLTNVARHSGATEVEVSLAVEPDAFELMVIDNGGGIPPERLTDPNSIGLAGMRERAQAFGGTVLFEGSPQTGTVVTARILRQAFP